MSSLRYPQTFQGDQVDTYHGMAIADPYRWLEDDQSADTKVWVKAQNAVTFAYLETLPGRHVLKERLKRLMNYPKRSLPYISNEGEVFIQYRNTGLQNQSVVYTMRAADEDGHVLLDPNTLSDDGTTALSGGNLSPKGRYYAYALSEGGSDWKTWRVRDVVSGQDLADELHWCKFSGVTWLPDERSFLYLGFDSPAEDAALTDINHTPKLRLHRLGTSQQEDFILWENPNEPEWFPHPHISDDHQYLLLSLSQGTRIETQIVYRPLNQLQTETPWTALIDRFEAYYQYLGNDGPVFYFHTDLDAERGRVIAIDIREPDKQHSRTLIAEQEDIIEDAQLLGDTVVISYLHHASHRLQRFSLRDGAYLGEIPLPGLGSVVLSAKRQHSAVFYSFTSFTTSNEHYRYTPDNDQSTRIYQSTFAGDTEAYSVRQIFTQSKDGTRVPYFLIHHKDLKPDGTNPTLLYGYGGFNINLMPAFSPLRMGWLEQGGVLAVATLRGGREYGKTWHQDGILANKQHTFDDFIACAEHLIATHITSSHHLAIEGGSNGGLLVGACMTQHPELFAAVVPEVGVLDMLRFHQFTIGWAWTSDYGSSDDPEQFEILKDYSPLHNIKKGTAYPATLIITGDHDDRVVPAHSFKFAATLQAANSSPNPTLIYIQTKAGHGSGKPTSLIIEEKSDMYAFLAHHLGLTITDMELISNPV